MRNEKISSELFAKIRRKLPLVERERHSEGEDVGLRKKEKPFKRGEAACKQGERYWEIGRKVRSGSFPSPALTN